MTEGRFGQGVATVDVFGGESAGDVGERVGVRTGAAVLASVERGDRVHVAGLELEVEQLEVLLHARRRHRLWEYDVAALDVPPQDDLRRRLADLVGGLGDGGILEHPAMRDGRPRLGGDPVLPVVLAHRVVGEVGVYLYLVHRRHRIGLGGQLLQVLDLEVRHPDRAGAAVAVEVFERPPGSHEVPIVEGGQRPVDKEQVHVVEAKIGECFVERLAGVLGLVKRVAELAGDEDVAAVEAGSADSFADLSLVGVHLRGVDVPVADPEGLAYRLYRILRLDLEDPETELGDDIPVVERDVGYRVHDRITPSSVVIASQATQRLQKTKKYPVRLVDKPSRRRPRAKEFEPHPPSSPPRILFSASMP